MHVFSGPLKGYLWHTASNYDYLTGEYENEEVHELFFSWLKAGSVFYDVGGHVGYYAFLAAQRITNGFIYSFEPVPSNIEIFNKHLQLNKSKLPGERIALYPYAISDREKDVVISNDPLAKEGNTYISTSPRFINTPSSIKVKGTSIDAMIIQGCKPPDVIKIDVEGAEYDVLNGARDTINTYRPKILLATHDWHLPGVKDKCILLLQSWGYELKHTGFFNKHVAGHDDYIATHKVKPVH